MARTHRKRPRKIVTLDRFLSFTSSSSKTSSSQEEKTEKKSNETHAMGIMEKKDRKEASIEETIGVEEKTEHSNKEQKDNIVEEKKADEEKEKGVDIIDDLFEALLVARKKVKRKESKKEQQKVEEKKTETSKLPHEENITGERTSKAIDKAIEEKTILGEIKIPTGDIIDKILQEGISPELTVCHPDGTCTDGRRLGEYFVDQFGFRRQRGFVRTTRTPIFTDWIVEEAVVSKLLPRAFKLETNRGAIAIVPEDFICELQARYGVILKNFDACKGYQVSLTGTASKSRKKK